MHRQPEKQRVYTSTFCAWRSHACCSCPLSISQDTRVLFTARRWNSGRADKLTEHVSFKRMAIAMPENSAVLLPYPVSRTGCCGWGLRWSKDNRPRPSNARRELDCGNGTGDSQKGIHRSARARGVTLALPWFPPTPKPANAKATPMARTCIVALGRGE